jgi:hypothetical protein
MVIAPAEDEALSSKSVRQRFVVGALVNLNGDRRKTDMVVEKFDNGRLHVAWMRKGDLYRADFDQRCVAPSP